MSISNYLEEAWLKTLRGGGNGTSFTAPAAVYVKLHISDPGEDGTSGAAAETDRVAATFNAPANPGGTMDNSGAVSWTDVAANETYSHISLWDNATAGNCLYTGALAAPRTVQAGDTFTIPAGDLDVSLA